MMISSCLPPWARWRFGGEQSPLRRRKSLNQEIGKRPDLCRQVPPTRIDDIDDSSGSGSNRHSIGFSRPLLTSGPTMKSGSRAMPSPSAASASLKRPLLAWIGPSIRIWRSAPLPSRNDQTLRLGAYSYVRQACRVRSSGSSGSPWRARYEGAAQQTSRVVPIRRPTRFWLPVSPTRTARSKPSSTRSTTRSESSTSKRICGWRAANAAIAGARWRAANVAEQVRRSVPRGTIDAAVTATSASSRSARSCTQRSKNA